MNCPRCGASNRDESRFCLSCGSRIDTVVAEKTTAVVDTGAGNGAVPVTPVPTSAGRRPFVVAGAAVVATLAVVAVGLIVLASGSDSETTSPRSATADDRADRDEAPSITQVAPPPAAEVTPTTNTTTTTLPATTAVATTAVTPPPPLEPTGFPFPNAFEVPQLGYEPVRGTGCGADASIGDVIPDGWWFGGVEGITAASLRLDLVCVYFGAEASTRIADCAATEDYDVCTAYWGELFWPVNNTERYRVVPVDAGMVRLVDSTQGCSLADVDQYEGDELSWVHIVGGRAVHIQHLCPGG